MKNITHLLFIITISLLTTTSLALAETISITTTEYPPFTTNKSQHGGFVNRVIREAFRRSNITVTYTYMPWKRVLVMAKNGDFDAASFSFENKEREEFFVFSQPLSDHREVFFHLNGTKIPKWTKLSELSNLKFGATRGYTYTEEFWAAAAENTIRVQETSSDLKNFKKLAAKRIDLFPMDEITGWNLLNESLSSIKDILKTSEKPLRATTGHLIISKAKPNHQALIDTFNKGLKKMRSDGTYDRYLDELFEGKY